MKARVLLFVLYVALTAFLAVHHEPWRDEVDSWLMARDASCSTIIDISPDAGTPALWYFALKPFATHGFPFVTQAALNLVFVWTAVAILIFQGPFSVVVLVSMCLSWFLSFEYPAVARNYGLGLLGLFALLGSWSGRTDGWPKRLQNTAAWPLVCFSSVHFLSFAPALMALDLFHRKGWLSPGRDWRSLVWPVLVFAVSVIALWPTGQGQLGSSFLQQLKPLNWVTAMSMGVFPFFSYEGLAAVLAPFVLYLVFRLSNRQPLQRRLIYLMFLGVNAIYVFKYFYPAHRFGGFNWLVMVTSAWAGLLYLKDRFPFQFQKLSVRLAAVFVALGLINLPGIGEHWASEVRRPFSDAGSTARFLEKEALFDRPIACYTADRCSALLGYTDRKIRLWYPGIDDWGTHLYWDRRYKESLGLTPEEAFHRARDYFMAHSMPDFVFISHEALARPEEEGLVQVFESPDEAWYRHDETFFVYAPKSPDPATVPREEKAPAGGAVEVEGLPHLTVGQYREIRDRLPEDEAKVLMCCNGCVSGCLDPDADCAMDANCQKMGRRTGRIKRHCLGMVPAFEPMTLGDCAAFIRRRIEGP